MSNTRTPDILTTHSYIVESTDLLGKETQHDVLHQLTTKVLDATTQIPMPHILEARLTVPVKGEDPETGYLLFAGPRTLSLELRTDDMPRRKERIPGAYTSSRFTWENPDIEQRILADSKFTFNTKRLLDVSGRVWRNGEDVGIESARLTDATGSNTLLRYLADLSGIRSLGVRRAADVVIDVSSYRAASVERTRATVDIEGIARQIQAATGKSVPESLRRAPHITYQGKRQLAALEGTPTIATNAYTIDTYSKESGRVITDWEMTQYNRFTPADPQHLVFYDVSTLERRPTGVSFGIDVRQDILALGDGNVRDRLPTSEAEAREMVSPYINAVASLRRYSTLANRQQAA